MLLFCFVLIPSSSHSQCAPLILREFIVPDSDLWFVRMDLCIPLDLLAVGNKHGKVSGN